MVLFSAILSRLTVNDFHDYWKCLRPSGIRIFLCWFCKFTSTSYKESPNHLKHITFWKLQNLKIRKWERRMPNKSSGPSYQILRILDMESRSSKQHEMAILDFSRIPPAPPRWPPPTPFRFPPLHRPPLQGHECSG